MEATGGLAPYRIDAEIAHSSICTIYRAYEENLDRPVLIKKLHPQMAREEDIRKRFEREAQVCARVKHENIVDIYSYRADGDATFLVMEFVEGENLGDLLKRQGRVEWQVALTMLEGVLQGLSHAHAKGVFHRDIKPDNLLVSKDGRVKITDFGLATIADSNRMTMQDSVVGTPSYLPPEQVSGGKFDHRGDLFSVGVTFYEILSGASPFSGANFSETLKKILTYTPPPLSSLIPDIPQEFDQILAHLMEKQPSKRTATAEAALEDVRKLATQRGVKLSRTTVLDSLHPEDNGSTPKPAVTLPAGQSTIAKNAFPVWAFGITAALVAMMLFWLPTRSQLIGDGLPKLKNSFAELAGRISASVLNGKRNPANANESRRSLVDSEVDNPMGQFEDPPARGPVKTPVNVRITDGQAVVSTAPGMLILTSRPWAMVTIDNVSHGQTPLGAPIELSPGIHNLTLSNSEFPTPFTETINIPPGGSLTLDANLWEIVGTIQVLSVKPWAEIFVDDVSYGLTPRAKPIIVTFGSHLIELRNPNYKLWEETVEFEASNRELNLNVQLEMTN